MPQRIVIVGGGFGGLYLAQALNRAPVEITLVDKRNFHLFQPLLYQVATGSLSPGEIAAPLRSVLSKQKNVRVLLAEALDLDPVRKRLILDTGEIEYDTLIAATGMQNHYFGNDAWKEHAPGLKTIEDATAVRHKLLYAFEAAEQESDPVKRRAWLTFVIVGAGPTGVELAGALGEIANDTLRNDFRSIRPEESRIILLDGGPRILSNFPEKLSEAAERSLIRIGVRSRPNMRVTKVDDSGVTFGNDRIDARTVLWAAGVKASDFAKIVAERTAAPADRQGRINVLPDLTVPGYPDIYAIGDIAHLVQNGNPLPGVAPVAMQQGTYVARRILGQSHGGFRYFDKGNLAVIGRASAVADIAGRHLSGLLAWLIWLFVHLLYIVEFESRILVAIRWGIQYFTFARGCRLITGPEEPRGPGSGRAKLD